MVRRRSRVLVCGIGVVAASLSAAVISAVPVQAAGTPGAVGAVDLQPVLTSGAAVGKQSGRLSPRLASLAAAPTLRRMSVATRSAALGLPADGAGSLVGTGSSVLVEARAAGPVGRTAAALRAVGATVVNESARYGVVSARVPTSALAAVGTMPSVSYAAEVLAPVTRSSVGAAATPSAALPGIVRAINTCVPGGVSEGDVQLKAAAARTAKGVDGTGVTVGVLSDSYDRRAAAVTHAATDIAAGDLPGAGNPCGRLTPVNVLADDPGTSGGDEGRAMLQIVHDLAPGASLAYATAQGGEVAFADNIRRLRNEANAKVIVDDIGYFAEPFFQDGVIATAIKEVTAAGAVYASAAGNDNLIVGGREVGSWESPTYRSTACPSYFKGSGGLEAAVNATYLDCMNMAPTGAADSARQVTLANGKSISIDLQWAQPRDGVSTDFDVFLVDRTAGRFASSVISNVTSSQQAFEFAGITNNSGGTRTYDVVIARYQGSAKPRLKYLLFGSNPVSIERPVGSGGVIVGPTVYGHAGIATAIAVGAVPYNNSAAPEKFSSRGPVTTYFGPYTGGAPAAALPKPLTLVKPDLAATDGGRTSFFAQQDFGIWRFFGTSAAAPHTAAVAALLLAKDPSLTPAQVRADLRATASKIGSYGANAVGSGLVNALAALSAPTAAPVVTSLTGGLGSVRAVVTTPPTAFATSARTECRAGAVVTAATGAVGAAVTLAPLVDDTAYLCRSRLTGAFGDGPWSAELAVTPGDITVPAVSLAAPAVVSLAAPLFRWTASDVKGVTSQQVRLRVTSQAGVVGAWSAPRTLSGSARSFAVALPRSGGSVCLEVAAMDAARNRTVAPVRCTATPIDDRSLRAGTSRQWRKTVAAAAFGRTLSVSTLKGATLTLARARGSYVTVIAASVRGGGQLGVYVRGKRVALLSLSSSRPVLRRVFDIRVGGLTGVPVVLKVETSRRPVTVDGLAVH